jgi:hypothetical protein
MAGPPHIPLVVPVLLFVGLPLPAWGQTGSSDPPLTYELLINGENFVIQANQFSRLESQEKPGVVYEVAVRIAPQQRVRLKNLCFEYAWPAKCEVEGRGPQPTARIRHELGYTILITDLGRSMEEETKPKALEILSTSAVESFTGTGASQIRVSQPHQRRFGHCDGRGVVIRYQDQQDVEHVCLVYVLTSEDFASSAIVHYLDVHADTVLQQIKAALDSVRAAK